MALRPSRRRRRETDATRHARGARERGSRAPPRPPAMGPMARRGSRRPAAPISLLLHGDRVAPAASVLLPERGVGEAHRGAPRGDDRGPGGGVEASHVAGRDRAARHLGSNASDAWPRGWHGRDGRRRMGLDGRRRRPRRRRSQSRVQTPAEASREAHAPAPPPRLLQAPFAPEERGVEAGGDAGAARGGVVSKFAAERRG